ncbi:hypothetical protein HO173_003770 [Letharia columbiana]|uniref:O-methyltransferase domain-containing protein n=1 Tax=Letharia columbiana TaxID=112416 RepID=A0A8H6L793_9LECA|nr:uncharacterized protein HO173_003770 [Letharia columbiana]KAF6238136.1 hypothetical protein HO173_003770 [Letharia columbiana]
MSSEVSFETPYDVSALLTQIASNGGDLLKGGEEARRACLIAARKLQFALEKPTESILRARVAEPAHHAALRIAVDLGLFQKMAESGEKITSVTHLAALTDADVVLLARLMKHLASMGTLYEGEIAGTYSLTPLSKALSQHKKFQEAIPLSFNVIGPSFAALPEYLQKTSYKNPHEDLSQTRYSKDHNRYCGPFQFAHNTPNDFWEWIAYRPERVCPFNNQMNDRVTGLSSWDDTQLRPLEEKLGKEAGDQDVPVLIVDVGGGKGRDLKAFHEKFSTLPGQLVLQDRASVLDDEEVKGLDDKIKVMEHDFFTPQPIKGARAYYLHSVLYDWSDEKCADIVANLKPAMTKGYSQLLITEHVIPDYGANWISTTLDMIMMCCFAGAERTVRDWETLLGNAGFKITGIKGCEPGTESLIEAELV